jgi:hypothetical protein
MSQSSWSGEPLAFCRGLFYNPQQPKFSITKNQTSTLNKKCNFCTSTVTIKKTTNSRNAKING